MKQSPTAAQCEREHRLVLFSPLSAGLVCVVLSACTGLDSAQTQTDSKATAHSSVLDQGWIAHIAQDPQNFESVVTPTSRRGWVAMHDCRWADAAAALPPGQSRARALYQESLVYGDLANLAAVAWPALATTWTSRDAQMATGPLPFLAALSTTAALHALSDSATTLPPPQQAFLRTLVTPVASPQAAGQTDPVLDHEGCLIAQRDLFLGKIPDAPTSCGSSPLSLDAEGTWYDPLVYAARAQALQRESAATARRGGGGAGALDLEALLFGEAWSQADLATGQPRVGDGPTLDSLGLPTTGTEDLPQAARERARALDAALDPWSVALLNATSDDGRALLSDLKLVEQYRCLTLMAWARAALAGGRPHQATAYLQLALDVENARSIGPLNPPSLYVLAAQASLATGRTRQALDYLSVLEPSYLVTNGLTETIGDLAVLEGLGRHGDSKEN